MERYSEAGCNQDVGDSSDAIGTLSSLTFEAVLPMTRYARPDATIAQQSVINFPLPASPGKRW